MVRRYAPRRTRTKRRPTRRTRRIRSKRAIRSKKKIYYFTRYANFGQLVISPLAPTLTAYTFRLADVPNSSEFTNLYDSYKIKAVKLTFYPAMTQSISTSTINAPAGETRCVTCLDRNDGVAPTSFDAVRQYQNAKVFQVNRRHSRYIYKPMVLDDSNYTINPWVNTTSPNVNYYGLKFAAEPSLQSSGTYQFSVEAKFYLAFKSVR